MKVNECMTPDAELITPDTTLTEVAQQMRDGDFGALPVGEDDRLIGMITDRDIVIRAIAEGRSADDTTVEEVMSQDLLYCYDDQDTDEVADMMGEHQVRRLPVVNRDKRFVGMIALGDLAQSQAPEANEALSKISRPTHQENSARQ